MTHTKFSEQHRRAIWERKWFPDKLSNDQFEQFVAQAEREGMDPLHDEIIATPRMDRNAGVIKMQVMYGINGLVKVAQRTGELEGFDGPYWKMTDDPEEPWRDYPTPGALYAKVGVFRKGFRQATYSAIHIPTYDTGRNRWREDAPGMGAKVARAQCLRPSFNNELSGVYAFEEMERVIQNQDGGPPSTPAPADNRTGKKQELLDLLMKWAGVTDRAEGIALFSRFVAKMLPGAQSLDADQLDELIGVARTCKGLGDSFDKVTSDDFVFQLTQGGEE